MKLTIWFYILILNVIITLQDPDETNAPFFRKKKKQCKGFEMSCAKGSDCCSGVCKLPDDDSEEQVLLGRYSLPEKDDCCDSAAVCRDKQCRIEESVCGKSYIRGIDCRGSCPLCKDGKCVASSADCGEPCPTGSSFECIQGGLCTNKICKCGTDCKLSNEECNDKSECCRNACTRVGKIGGKTDCS